MLFHLPLDTPLKERERSLEVALLLVEVFGEFVELADVAAMEGVALGAELDQARLDLTWES